MLKEDFPGGFGVWQRQRDGQPCSLLVTIPGAALLRNKQTYRSDIKWMWNLLAGTTGRVRVGEGSYLTLLVTDEERLYHPKTEVVRGSFEDAMLLRSWIKFVTKHSWWKQKKGQLRKLFKPGQTVPDMLAAVSAALIEMEE